MTQVVGNKYTIQSRNMTEGTQLVFVPGLSDGEKDFIRENKSRLGSGAAKQAADYTHARWVNFRSTPIVLQLLAWVAAVVIIISIPYVLMYIGRATQSRESQTRMLTSLGAGLSVTALIAAVHMFL